MPSTGNQNGGSQTFAEATTTGIDLTYARGCDFWRPFVILTEWRVRARPARDSDPVRRHGPERGSTGGGGRPRSFPSGPSLIRRQSDGPFGRRGPHGLSPYGSGVDIASAARLTCGKRGQGSKHVMARSTDPPADRSGEAHLDSRH